MNMTYRSQFRRCCLRSRLVRRIAFLTQYTIHCHSGTAAADTLQSAHHIFYKDGSRYLRNGLQPFPHSFLYPPMPFLSSPLLLYPPVPLKYDYGVSGSAVSHIRGSGRSRATKRILEQLQPWARAVCTSPAVPRSTQPLPFVGR